MGYDSNLVAVLSCIRGAKAGINMSLPACNNFLKRGELLNIYEATAKETGKTGAELLKEIKRRIPNWYAQRRTIDKLFRFRHDTHYAALNLGGAGAQNYGACCVIFDLTHWEPYFTCFGGDTIRACFDSNGKKILSDTDILQHFAVGQDMDEVAVVKHESYLNKKWPGLDLVEVQAMLEDSDSLLEFHLHGPVKRDQINKIVIARDKYIHYCDIAEKAESRSKPWPQEYDVIPFFVELVDLTHRYKIPLVCG